jgi:Rrf2 family transcriptional regulator, iron-sulfur cluster assembly transcription factor
MDLTLSRAGDYALRAAIALAGGFESEGSLTIREVSEEMDLPRSYTPQVLGMLVRAGIATSRPGRGGGFRLSRPPSKITMLEVVEAAEGSLVNARCPLSGGPCRWDDACAVHPTWVAAADAVRTALDRATLESVAREDRDLGVGRRRRSDEPRRRRG